MPEKSNSNQQMNEPLSRRILDGLLLNQNSTFDILLKILAVIVVMWFLRAEVQEWRSLYAETNGSIVNGCVLPAHLLTDKKLPALPEPQAGQLTIEQERNWLLAALDVYQTWGVDIVADRIEIVKLCR